MAVLAPGEDPGNGAQILNALGAETARRARADFQERQFLDRACGMEIAEQGLVLRQLAIGLERQAGDFLDRLLMLGIEAQFRFFAGFQRVNQNARGQHFEIVQRGAAIGEFGGDDFALLGHAHVAIDRACGLGGNGAAGRRAAAAHRTAAAMEEADVDARLACRRACSRRWASNNSKLAQKKPPSLLQSE